jgi:hypothetical protein|tara:strand:- start:831 stop:1031 length:201 start_codon:yes stop_codon:yes gene_type:complete
MVGCIVQIRISQSPAFTEVAAIQVSSSDRVGFGFAPFLASVHQEIRKQDIAVMIKVVQLMNQADCG